MSKIEKLKKEMKVKTSENLFHIEPPYPHQCDNIDKICNSIEEIHDLAKSGGRYGEENLDELIYTISEVEYLSKDLADKVEDIREAIELVRLWGEEWKHLAKTIIENNDIDLENYT